MKEFNAHLWNFGRHGAVRRDVSSALALTSTVLGAGGCGKVFLANKWDATGDYIDSNLAVKELLPKGKPVECTLRTEIEFLAAAQGHPNVAILHGVFHQIDSGDSENVFKAPGSPEEVMTQDKEVGRDRWFIALQLYTSGDLFERVQRSGPLKEAESVEVMLGLLSALAYVHHLGIVHRDVKCENILLDGNHAILSDFGISCFLSDPESMEKRVGSPGYASPEMLKGESYNEKVDIFSTGVALYFALSRSLPFADSSVARVLARTVRCNIHWHQEKFQHFSGGLVKLCKILLSKDPWGPPPKRPSRPCGPCCGPRNGRWRRCSSRCTPFPAAPALPVADRRPRRLADVAPSRGHRPLSKNPAIALVPRAPGENSWTRGSACGRAQRSPARISRMILTKITPFKPS